MPQASELGVRHCRTRPGDRWLKACLGVAAMAASRKRNCYSNTQYRCIAARRGARRTRIAVGHSLLIAARHVLTTTNTA